MNLCMKCTSSTSTRCRPTERPIKSRAKPSAVATASHPIKTSIDCCPRRFATQPTQGSGRRARASSRSQEERNADEVCDDYQRRDLGGEGQSILDLNDGQD